MSHRSEKRARRASRTRSAMVAAMSVEALCLTVPRLVLAQAAPASGTTAATTQATSTEVLEEVVVSGYRESLDPDVRSIHR